jgi:hypothetical protein
MTKFESSSERLFQVVSDRLPRPHPLGVSSALQTRLVLPRPAGEGVKDSGRIRFGAAFKLPSGK